MNLISAFVKEQKRYTKQELSILLGCKNNDKRLVHLLRKLKAYGVLKSVRCTNEQMLMSDLQDEDVQIIDVASDVGQYYHVFTFVGVVVIEGIVLKCYPKYLPDYALKLLRYTFSKNVANVVIQDNDVDLTENDLAARQILEANFKQVLKVITKYNSKSEENLALFTDFADSKSYNLLSIMFFLLDDYFERGIYKKQENIIESNGNGEILWDRTINETFTLISNNRPYYMELKTRKRVADEYAYITRLHQCLLTEISRIFAELGLLELFDLPEVVLSEDEKDDFGDNDYLLYRLEYELNTQFNTQKQMTLKALYIYLNHRGNNFELDGMSYIGSNSFNLVWEKVCAEILDNQLNTSLKNLKLPKALQAPYNNRNKYKCLKDVIDKPFWSASSRQANLTLIPDIVTLGVINDCLVFIIFDAKYYNAHINFKEKLYGQPGIESITKQYLYQLAYKNFLEKHEIEEVRNCFLMPTDADVIKNKGFVSLGMLFNIGLQRIDVRFLPATMAYTHYLNNTKLALEKLNL